ncbi:MAG: hypothetical protein NVSMB6_10240 [Burkholderiaceae bacterium]
MKLAAVKNRERGLTDLTQTRLRTIIVIIANALRPRPRFMDVMEAAVRVRAPRCAGRASIAASEQTPRMSIKGARPIPEPTYGRGRHAGIGVAHQAFAHSPAPHLHTVDRSQRICQEKRRTWPATRTR